MRYKDVRQKEIGSRIRIIRKELGLTMKEFGEKFDPIASDSIVSRWERGISSPNNERLKKIAELGNMSVMFLTSGNKSFKDLSEDEFKEMYSKSAQKQNQVNEEQEKYIANEFDLMLSEKLDSSKRAFFTNILTFLHNSNDEELKSLTALLIALNSKNNVENKEVTTTQEDIKEFIDDTAGIVRELLMNRFEYKDGE